MGIFQMLHRGKVQHTEPAAERGLTGSMYGLDLADDIIKIHLNGIHKESLLFFSIILSRNGKKSNQTPNETFSKKAVMRNS